MRKSNLPGNFRWRCAALIFAALILEALSLAASPLSAQSQARPGQASFNLETANGQRTFHIGERIPLKLTFRSPDDTGFQTPRLIRGRGGEFDCNRFEVASPAVGWSDPLEMYFRQDLLLTGHGWGPEPLKRSKPVEASLNLNDWIRFDQPGEYTVRVTSFCVSRGGSSEQHSLSKTITLQIVPATPEWQDDKFKSILANLDLLDLPPPVPAPGNASQLEWDRRNQAFEGARADLRYLATPAAIEEMTRRLRSGKYNFSSEASIGLMGLPPAIREIAISSMNKRIEEPDFPITSSFFSTLTFLHVSPGSEKEEIRKQREAIKPVIWTAIFSAVTQKDSAARAETVQTLIEHGRDSSAPEIRAQMASLLKVSFLDLDSRSQTDDLLNEWDRLRSPEFLRVLQTLARLPVRSDDDLQVFVYDRQQLKGLALKRWYELDPEGAHREITEQIGSAAPSLAAQSIVFLPQEQFPQFETIWAKALLDTTSQLRERAIGSLLVRFGAGGVTNQMIAKLEEKRDYPCDAHIVALAYLVRFSPNLARQRLKREFPGECGDQLLRFISELTTSPVLNDLAVENLDSSDSNVVRDAVQYLNFYGRKEDEDPLWRRYVQWTSAYEGKANLLDRPGTDSSKTLAFSAIGAELGGALISNQGWFADAEFIARVLKRCIGKSMCEQLKSDADWAVAPYRLTLPNLQTPPVGMSVASVVVGQYVTHSLQLFDAKIGQFPPGSKFVLDHWYRPSNSDEQALADNVRSILERHGMSLGVSPK